MRVDFVTKEYPPNVYGGAGVHVAELVKFLRKQIEVRVHAFGSPVAESLTYGYEVPDSLKDSNSAVQTLGVNLEMMSELSGSELVHSHTWYANFAGQIASQLYSMPHVITAHSLEPLRPWKKEQLGGGYAVSSFIERAAYESASQIIAVSDGMRKDIFRAYPQLDREKVSVVHNGIDCSKWKPMEVPGVLERYGIDKFRPSVIFVGRITRQKGLTYFLRAAQQLPEDVQLILCAGASDTPEILSEVQMLVEQLQKQRTGVIWIPEHLPQDHLATLLTAADLFVCPSIYEPLGIVNLEAMACATAIVATKTGGIPEVVSDNETGWLVPINQATDGSGTPLDPEKFIGDFAKAMNHAISSPRLKQFGEAGRARAEQLFSWDSIATRTLEVYRQALGR